MVAVLTLPYPHVSFQDAGLLAIAWLIVAIALVALGAMRAATTIFVDWHSRRDSDSEDRARTEREDWVASHRRIA